MDSIRQKIEIDPFAEMISIIEDVTATITCRKTKSTCRIAVTGNVGEASVAFALIFDKLLTDDELKLPVMSAVTQVVRAKMEGDR